MAKQQGGGAGAAGAGGLGDMDQLMKQMGLDPAELQKMMGDVDPKMLEELADLGPKLDEMMKVMSEMSPEELQKQMQDAMELMAGSDMMGSLFQNQEQILKSLEESGAVDKEELEKFKKDPEYFEQKMKEGFDQMKDLFSNPEVLKAATESMKVASEMYKNPEMTNQMFDSMFEGLDDDKIEEVRLMFLKDPDSNPFLKEMIGEGMNAKELQDIVSDPKKWRDNVKQGLGMIKNPGAGVGEL